MNQFKTHVIRRPVEQMLSAEMESVLAYQSTLEMLI